MIEILLGLVGLAMGSFISAFTWRLHEGKDFVADRSQCEACGHKLGIRDLVPVVSWIMLKGRCRYCSKAIGWQNPAMELVMAGLFVGSYMLWPYEFSIWQSVASFGIWLVYMVMLGSLVVYDFKWMLLPDVVVYPLIVLGLVDAGLRLSIMDGFSLGAYALHVVLGVLALGGVYGALYAISGGKWVGFGDVKLGVFMGAVVGWQLALALLFIANVVGFIVILPGLLMGKLTHKSRVPFGPFMIVGFIIVGLIGGRLLNWYMSIIYIAG